MSFVERLRSTEVSTRTAAISVGLLLVLAVIVVVSANKLAGGSPSGRPAKPRVSTRVSVSEFKSKPKAKTAKGDKKAKITAAKPAKADTAVTSSVNPNVVITERNLFRPVGGTSGSSAKPEPRLVVKAVVPNVPGMMGGRPGQLPTIPSGAAPPGPPPNQGPKPGGGNANDFKKIVAFTGLVETTSGTQALVENIQSKETRFVSRGESAFGCKVVTISARSLTLEKDGSQFTLGIGENKPDSDGAKPPPPGGGGGPPPNEGRPGGPRG